MSSMTTFLAMSMTHRASDAMDSALSAKVQWRGKHRCGGIAHVVSLALMVAAIAIAAAGEVQ
jgi:hypothetical protein